MAAHFENRNDVIGVLFRFNFCTPTGVFNARNLRNSDGVKPKLFMPRTTERKGHKEREATLYFNSS
jgi:hypothetical protein